MPHHRPADVADAMSAVAAPIIRAEFEARSCIASTRIGLDALAYFGVRAIPVPLFLMVLNEAALEMLEAGATFEEVSAESWRHSPDDPTGPWTLGVGAETPDPSGWPGHLMIGLPDERLLLDLALGQAWRPTKQILVPDAAVLPVPEEGWWADPRARHVLLAQAEHPLSETGQPGRLGFVLDRDCADPEGYRRSRNWQRTGSRPDSKATFKRVTGQVIRATRERLAG